MNRLKVFLSAASVQFRECRNQLASDLRAIGCEVIVQEDFQQHPRTLLQKLQEKVDQADRVIAIMGDAFGFAPEDDPQHPLLPDGTARRSYSQWEYYFALGEQLNLDTRTWAPKQSRKDIFVYFASADYLAQHPVEQPENDYALQKDFITFIKTTNEDRNQFCNAEQLCRLVLRDGWQMQSRPHRPIQLPYPSIGTLFKGRGQFIQQLRESLQQSSDHQATAITGKAVHGLGGVGKTRLAVEYAWQHADDYSAVLCVTADSPENLRKNLAELTGPLVLDLAEHSATEEEARVAAALHWLQTHPGWFLILDNVDTEEAVVAVERLLVDLRGGQVLITSRLARFSDFVDPLELDVISPGDGAAFLLEKTQPKGHRGRKRTDSDQADALELASELDGLALALEQAGAYIVQLRHSFAEYLALWRSHKAEVQEWLNTTIQYAGPTDGPLRSVAVTWQTTIDHLGEVECELLNLLAWFAPDPVPLSLFEPFSASKSESPAQPLWSEAVFREALSNLADFSMLVWDVEAATVTVHRVVQEILRTWQAAPLEYLQIVLQLLSAALPDDDPSDVRTWLAWEPLRTHVAFATSEADSQNIAEPTSYLMGELGSFLWAKALHREAEPLMRRALAIDERHFGVESTQAAIRLNNLALLLHATNRLSEAAPLMRRALAIDEQSYGPEHPMVATRLNNLAQLLRATNCLSEAEPLMARVVTIFEKSYGENHPKVATAQSNLAQLLQGTNRLLEAEQLMRRALAIDEQSYGPEHPEVATDLNNLAQLLQTTNRLSEAEPLSRRQVAIFRAFAMANEHEHPHMRAALANYFGLLVAMGLTENEARAKIQEMLRGES